MQNTLFLPGPVLHTYSNSVAGLSGYTFFVGPYGPVQIYTETGISLPTSSIFLFPKIIARNRPWGFTWFTPRGGGVNPWWRGSDFPGSHGSRREGAG